MRAFGHQRFAVAASLAAATLSQGHGNTPRRTGTVHSRPGTVWLDEL